jgi:hypothetical protein
MKCSLGDVGFWRTGLNLMQQDQGTKAQNQQKTKVNENQKKKKKKLGTPLGGTTML